MKYLPFNYSTVKPSQSVIVLAGGYSTGLNLEKIKLYQQENNSILIAANYNYKIPVNFTYFTDMRKFFEQIHNIEPSSNIILRQWAYNQEKKRIDRIIESIKYPRQYYLVGLPSGPLLTIYKSKPHNLITSTGEFNYCTLGICGIGCLVLSLCFRPSKILVTGIDGPDLQSATKLMFDGRRVRAHVHKVDKIKKFLTNCLFPYFAAHNIVVQTFDNVGFYGLDKNILGMEIIK